LFSPFGAAGLSAFCHVLRTWILKFSSFGAAGLSSFNHVLRTWILKFSSFGAAGLSAFCHVLRTWILKFSSFGAAGLSSINPTKSVKAGRRPENKKKSDLSGRSRFIRLSFY
jgi:hypothetical protein